ncbi:MAG: type VI secretion system tip protein TssI/VgrG [Polyangiaceae bacterium]
MQLPIKDDPASPARALEHPFTLRVADKIPGLLVVTELRGREAMNRPYVFRVDGHVPVDLGSSGWLGCAAVLSIDVPNRLPRQIAGVVTALHQLGETRDGNKRLRVELRPSLWLLTRRKTSRVFQERGVREIVDSVLAEHRVDCRWELAKPLRQRTYVVQYRESDYDFVARLLAEAGLVYRFEVYATKDAGAMVVRERMVVSDTVAGYDHIAVGEGDGLVELAAHTIDDASRKSGEKAALPPPGLLFSDGDPGSAGDELILSIRLRRAIYPQVVRLRDFDFEHPLLSLDLRHEAGASDKLDKPRGGLESALASRPLSDEPLAALSGLVAEVYDHHGEYEEHDVEREHAVRRLEQERARAVLLKGKSVSRRLSPGLAFTLRRHPDSALDNQALVTVKVEHRGSAPLFGESTRLLYENRFEAVPATIPYRPLVKKRDLSNVVESATVVGPRNEAIHADVHGRVKVQFHWDLDGKRDDKSSCWIRVLAPWAGPGFGASFLPRIGSEVLVGFMGGDEDRPVVLGGLFNATNPPPFKFPEQRNMSGIRSQTIDGSRGNELSFDDTPGAQELRLIAERDLLENARFDRKVVVGKNQDTKIDGSLNRAVTGDHRSTVGGDETRSIKRDSSTTISRDKTETVGGERVSRVAGLDISKLGGESVDNKGDRRELVRGHNALTVGTDARATGHSVLVHGPSAHEASGPITYRSDAGIVFECGDSRISVRKDGIRLDSKRITAHAGERVLLMSDGPAIELGSEIDLLADTIRLFSKGGSVELDAEAAHVDGPVVKLNCGPGSAPDVDDTTPAPKTKRFKWRCLDSMLDPYANKTYRLTTQGFRTMGKTNQWGTLVEEVPDDAFIAVLTIWTGTYPEGERHRWTIRIGPIPPTSTIYGAVVRLRNMGYYVGPDTEVMNDDLGAALVEFQSDYDIPSTGELDEDTIARLAQVYPNED